MLVLNILSNVLDTILNLCHLYNMIYCTSDNIPIIRFTDDIKITVLPDSNFYNKNYCTSRSGDWGITITDL